MQISLSKRLLVVFTFLEIRYFLVNSVNFFVNVLVIVVYFFVTVDIMGYWWNGEDEFHWF